MVVTGGAAGIGKTISEEFRKAGARVCVIDKDENDYFVGDIVDEKTLKKFSEKVIADNGDKEGRGVPACVINWKVNIDMV